jgi:Mrp family chromosome partitioning ATPase
MPLCHRRHYGSGLADHGWVIVGRFELSVPGGDQQVQLRDVGGSLRRHWGVAALLLVLIPLAMGLYVATLKPRTPDRFNVSADILIPTIDPKTRKPPEGVPDVLLHGQGGFLSLHTQNVALAAADLPVPSPDVLFAFQPNEDQDIITLVVSAPDAAIAGKVLGAYMQAYSDARREATLKAASDRQGIDSRLIILLTQRLDEIQAQLGPSFPLPPIVPDNEAVPSAPGTPTDVQLLLYERNSLVNEILRRQTDYGRSATATIIPGDYTTVVQQRPPLQVTVPPPSRVTPLVAIGVIGLLLAIGLPILMDRLNPSITDAEGAAAALRTRTLGSIPAIPRRMYAELAPPASAWDAAYRALAATSISTDRLPRSILVTSPRGSIQDPVAANFAGSLAALGLTVALVGTAPRHGWFQEITQPVSPLGPPVGEEGSGVYIPEYLTGGPAATEPAATRSQTTVSEAPVPTFRELLELAHRGQLAEGVLELLGPSAMPGLYVVPPGNDEIDLSLDGLPPLLEAFVRDNVDVTVIAGPALLEDPNATIVGWSTRSVLWVLELGRVHSRDAQLAADRIEIAGVEPFGVALVDRRI